MFGSYTKFVIAAVAGILVILQQFVGLFPGQDGKIFSAVCSGLSALLVAASGPGNPFTTVTAVARKPRPVAPAAPATPPTTTA